MRLLLDTVVLIFAGKSPERLSPNAAAALKDAANILEVSSISLTEIAVKVSLGKLDLTAPAVYKWLEQLGARVLPHTADHALELFTLPVIHRDPFDRQIIAQALVEKIPVVTPDGTFRLYKGLRVIW